MNRWIVELQICLERIIKEINFLRIEKNATENDLDALDQPLTIITECLTQRDSRLIGELTQDNANIELKRELKIVESNKKMLIDQCQLAWNMLNRLEEIKCKLDVDVKFKDEARECDYRQLTLSNSSDITFKTDPMRNSKK